MTLMTYSVTPLACTSSSGMIRWKTVLSGTTVGRSTLVAEALTITRPACVEVGEHGLRLTGERRADDAEDRLVGDVPVLLARRLGRVALGVELLQLVGELRALLVPLVDGDLHAVPDVHAEVGVVAGEGPDQADGDLLLAVGGAAFGRLLRRRRHTHPARRGRPGWRFRGGPNACDPDASRAPSVGDESQKLMPRWQHVSVMLDDKIARASRRSGRFGAGSYRLFRRGRLVPAGRRGPPGARRRRPWW